MKAEKLFYRSIFPQQTTVKSNAWRCTYNIRNTYNFSSIALFVNCECSVKKLGILPTSVCGAIFDAGVVATWLM